MVYDGDCNFCKLWIRRWEAMTGGQVDYLPYQDPQIRERFPELPQSRFESAVQLVHTDGEVSSGAEAVFRAIAFHPHGHWLLDLYLHWPVFAHLAEASYRFVARHRPVFSFFTRLLWGRHVEPATHSLVRWAFLRCLGIVYLLAFVSLWIQVDGLIGSRGILPANVTMDAISRQATLAGVEMNRYHLVPTLCWWSSSDTFLHVQCAAGTALGLLVALGIAQAPCLFLLWVLYLSLTTVSGVFMGYQWDNLLLETGLLSIFFAPLHLWPRRPSREPPPSRAALWLLRWLLFRLMFQSGWVKWMSGDPEWRSLTALAHHYETQPLPTWIAWHMHQLPLWFHKADAGVLLAIELGVPFLIFTPRRPRQFACLCFVALQIFILLTGNYGFFNLLALALCITLLDDASLRKCVPSRRIAGCAQRSPTGEQAPATGAGHRSFWQGPLVWAMAVVVAGASVVEFLALARAPVAGPAPVVALYRWLLPLRSFNTYGLFAVMTTTRPEIVVEGSNDGVRWEPYEFKYKPGDLEARPRFVAPHQPRLDWQMWFAALSTYSRNPWFVDYCFRLLQGSPEVLRLMQRDPFHGTPPRYIRAVLYQYQFTDAQTRKRTGAWWRREWAGLYLPPLSLRQGQ